MKWSPLRWAALVSANAFLWGVLSFYGPSEAQQSRRTKQPRGAQQPFSNAVQQRQEMVRELHEIKQLLREQNTLLRAGASANDSHGKNSP